MKTIASAPGRCGVLGNPTDGYGGSVISCSLAERATVTVRDADAMQVTIGDEHCRLTDRDDYRLQGDRFDCVRAVLTYFRRLDLRLDVTVQTEIPVQAGLAGSTAILTSLVRALTHHWQQPIASPHLLAETVRTVELNFLEIQCGYQDQYMTVFGGLNFLDFRDKEYYRDLAHEVFATVERLDTMVGALPLLVAHTGKHRVSGTVLRPLRERWEDGDTDVIQGYQRIGQLARQGKRALIEGKWSVLARLMNENHTIQQRLGASGESNDHLIRTARAAGGALAAKLAGAGGGGTIIVLTLDPDRTRAALSEAGATQILTPSPSHGARLESHES